MNIFACAGQPALIKVWLNTRKYGLKDQPTRQVGRRNFVLKEPYLIKMPNNFWIIGICVALLVAPSIASLMSVITFILAAAAWKVWLVDNRDLKLTKLEKICAWIIAFYVISMSVIALAKFKNIADLDIVFNNIWLLFSISLLPIFRIKADKYWFAQIAISIMMSAIILATAMIIVDQFSLYNIRLFSGNALILAYLAGATFIFSLVYFLFWSRLSSLCLAALLSSVIALALISERGPILAAGLTTIPLLLLALKCHWKKVAILLGGTFAAGALIFATGGKTLEVFSKFSVVLERLANPFNADIAERSIYIRFVMYRDGWQAFKASPLFGHGRQNVIEAINTHGLSANTPTFSHLHNALVTEAVASGIFGMLGLLGMYTLPILVSWRGTPIIRLMGLSFSAYFFLYTSSNIGFYHDVTIFWFMLIVAILGAAAMQQQDHKIS